MARGLDRVEQRQHVVGTDTDAVAGARDEAQLDPRGRLAGGEELLVAVVVDQDLGQQRRAGVGEAGSGEPGVEHLDGDVLHSRCRGCRGSGHAGRGLGPDEHECHATGGQRADPGLRRTGHGHFVEPEA